jgi:hypothetical protein
MGDTHQAVYDAVRSRIGGVNIGDVVRDVARDAFDISWQKDAIKQAFVEAAWELSRPFVLLKPPIYPDGDAWCVLLGADLQTGIAGFGDTPEKAAQAFDEAWRNAKTPATLIKEKSNG